MAKCDTNKLKYDVVIIGGLGHVGLPLGISFAQKGMKVCLYDTDKGKAEMVLEGIMPFIEYGADPILRDVVGRTLDVTLEPSVVAQAQYVIVAIGTPLDEHLSPKIRPFFDLFESLREHFYDGQTLIIRSTVYPKICQQLGAFLQKTGLRVKIAYCPERIVQGYAIQELPELPQIVAGLTPEAEEEGAKLFSILTPKIIRTRMGEAELIKLFANALRYIEFAVTNQFYMIATAHGEDYGRVRKAMREGYGRAVNLPSAGLTAGPCLLKDTMQLASFTSNTFHLGHAAMMVNEGVPDFLVLQLSKKRDLSRSRVGILGMAFKANIDDIRDSLSFRLNKILKFHGADVLCSDEYVKDPTFVSKEELLRRVEIAFIGAPHDAYKTMEIPPHVELIDIWGITKRKPDAGHG